MAHIQLSVFYSSSEHYCSTAFEVPSFYPWVAGTKLGSVCSFYISFVAAFWADQIRDWQSDHIRWIATTTMTIQGQTTGRARCLSPREAQKLAFLKSADPWNLRAHRRSLIGIHSRRAATALSVRIIPTPSWLSSSGFVSWSAQGISWWIIRQC